MNAKGMAQDDDHQSDERPTEETPNRARRALQRNLILLREESDKTIEQLTRMRCGTKSSWSRWSRGLNLPGPEKVSWICDHLGVTSERKERMVELATASIQPTWYEEDTRGLALTRGFLTLLELELIAEHIRIFAPMMVPGLLQTPAYQKAMFEVWPGLTTSKAEQQGLVRTKRQELTLGKGIACTTIIGQEALMREVGGPETMREQLDYLLRLSTQPHIQILILPFTAGAHPGGRGEFTLMSFPPSEQEPPFSYSEGYQGAECSDATAVISNFEERWDFAMMRSVPIQQHVKEYAA